MAATAVLMSKTEFLEDTAALSSNVVGFSGLVERLETARARLEERFLDGGAALLSILDVLNKLIGSLDQITGSLDGETASATMTELQQTVGRLSELSEIETMRQAGFADISGAEQNLRPHVANMQETMRYLRTFAVTAKITGADIADFAGFAEEILERIHAGTKQVNEFGSKLASLGAGLGPLMARGAATVRRYEATIPGIVADLSTGGADISAQQRVLFERAAKVRQIAAKIQGKLASILSAMQIGDITRQRIEHCQSSFTLMEGYVKSGMTAFSADDRTALSAIITNLVALQLSQTIDDFDRDTAKIVDTVASFRSDFAEIDSLRRMMGDGGDNAMRRLEDNVGVARQAVGEIEAVAVEAEKLSQAAGVTVRELIDGVESLQLVRTDIHYMALNTNLRCGKIGEHGKALHVVTAELRNFAGKLDETAEMILVELKTLEAASDKFGIGHDRDDQELLDSRLARAMQNISAVGDKMDAAIEVLDGQSRAAVGEMDASLSRLDFKAELGEVLRGCADEIAVVENVEPSAGLLPVLEELGGRIAALYTMVSERELHAVFLGTPMPKEVTVAASVMSDDDIDDALF